MVSIQQDEDKTKKQLINELGEMRRRIAELGALEVQHKQAEEALRESEEKYRGLVTNVKLGVFRHSKELMGVILEANPAMAKILGYPRKELVGMKVLDLYVHPEERLVLLAELAATREEVAKELRWRRKDRSEITVLVTKVAVRDDAGDILYIDGILEDITERKQAEEALRESEEKYRGLIDHSQDIIYLLHEGKFEIINQRFEELLGYTLEEANSSDFDFMNLVAPKSRAFVEERVDKVARGETVSPRYEFTAISRDGTEFEAETSVSYIRYKGGIAVQGITRDITERKRAERRIQHLTEVLRAIRNINQLITREKDRQKLLKGVCETLIETRGYDNSWVAIFGESGELVTTAESGFGEAFLPFLEHLRRGRLPLCGSRALRESGVVVIGNTLLDCIGCPLSEGFSGRRTMTVWLEHAGKVYGLLSTSFAIGLNAHEEERSLFQEVADDIALALHSIELEEKHKRAEKELQQAHDTLEIRVEERTAALEEANEALRAEITQRKRMECRIEEQREYLASVLHSVPDAIVTVDASIHVVEWNPGAERLFGYSSDDVRGKNVSDVVTRPDIREQAIFLSKQIVSGKELHPIEVIRYRKDGTPVNVILAGSPIMIGDKVVGAVAVYTDITERKRAEEELRSKEMQLIHAGRLSSLGEMATGVAHEINQPLAIISMAAEGRLRDIEKGRFDVSILPQELEDILKNVRRIDRIITHMRTFARRAGEWESVNSERVLDDVFILLGEQFRMHKISISREIEAGLPSINVDANQLEQVFVNILTNARQVLDERAEEAERDGKAFEKRLVCGIYRDKEEAGEYMIFEFADNAYGVPDELKTRVFDPFFTTKEAGQGTGLGLSITYGIVTRSLDGRIWVEDNAMGGASFKVALPLQIA